MALTLSASIEERNDNKVITITDTTVNWGSGGNIAVTDVDGVNYGMELEVTITISDQTATTYTAIDLVSEFGPFATQADLVFEIDASMLLNGTSPLGTSDDELPDGIYTINYIVYDLDPAKVEYASVDYDTLIDGRVTVAVYEKLRDLPDLYDCTETTCHEKEVLDIIFMYTYLQGMHASAYVAREESLLNQLAVLERLVTNVSNYTW